MKFLKPRFWDKNKISLFPILLMPVSLVVNLINFFKGFLVAKNNSKIPVICVGNIYLGGTGKTPFAIELFSILKDLNKRSVFIRKKYPSFKDEVELLKLVGPVYENSSRRNAINEAIKNGAEIAILDDGFQDFSIKKNLSIVCFNEKQWIGNGLVIPAGPLRESLQSLQRADCVVINGKKNPVIEKKILEKSKKIKIYYTKYKALNIEDFKNVKVLAFAGIGNPDNFFDLIEYNNIQIFEKISFPDHYYYSDKELENLINKAKKNNATLLTTEKDFLRIDEIYKKNMKYLKIKIEIENKNEFLNEIKKII